MKKRFVALLTAVLLTAAPVYVQADEKDGKIVELEAKVNDLEKEIRELKEKLSKYETKSGTDMESYLIEKNLLSGDRVEMASDMVGAVSGFKYGDAEIYKYDMESESYKNLIKENKVTLKDFGIDLVPLAINKEYVLFGEASEELIAAFNEFKGE